MVRRDADRFLLPPELVCRESCPATWTFAFSPALRRRGLQQPCRPGGCGRAYIVAVTESGMSTPGRQSRVIALRFSAWNAAKRLQELKKGWSGQPDSNRRHQPWQGCTLPTELCPLDRSSRRVVKPFRLVKAGNGDATTRIPSFAPRVGGAGQGGGDAGRAGGDAGHDGRGDGHDVGSCGHDVGGSGHDVGSYRHDVRRFGHGVRGAGRGVRGSGHGVRAVRRDVRSSDTASDALDMASALPTRLPKSHVTAARREFRTRAACDADSSAPCRGRRRCG